MVESVFFCVLVLSVALFVCLLTWLIARKIYLHAQQGGVEQTSVAVAKTQSSASPVQVNETEVDSVLEEQPVEDPQWDDWDELDDEVVEDEAVVYEEYEDVIEEDEADQAGWGTAWCSTQPSCTHDGSVVELVQQAFSV